ncbi:MAG TPA: protein kinase [Kiritimatiellia bacterium]|nr:protein kinase [Kiritimatiellia bacterium]HRZ11362.1 protein kinase [Kiritimatiellia bacterium]HSA17087.1 protein kinase [Kiritimatiellia bacterium]
MNPKDKRHDPDTIPMSGGAADVTQTMIQEGMLQAPARPGARGAVGRFEILRPLAAGGMGQVFLAREPVTDGRVAIKMIRPRYRGEEWVVRRFLAEAQHMYRMSHPHILKVMEVSDRKEGPYYVMPFIEGGSLAQAIKPGQPLPEDRVLEIARQVADALQYAHARGIIHRDIKPANVLLDNEGRAYLTDFGLLRTVFNDTMLDPDKSAPEGTAAYMSPLAASGKAEDTRCDIYSFGALLYEMLTGCKPYEGPNPKAVADRILAGPPRPILAVNRAASPALARIAEWCMARELRDRYAEMKDVVRDLDRAGQKEAPLGPHGAAEGQAVMVLKLSGKRSVGKALAAAGTFLQGLCAVSLLWTIIHMIVAHLAADPQQPVSLAQRLGSAAAPAAFGFLLGGVAGWFLLALALWACRYRAPWFYQAMHIIAIPWLLVFPAGTLASVLVLIHLREHKAEFAAEPPAARPTLFMYFESAAVVAIAVFIAGLFGHVAYNMARRQARPSSAAQPASSAAQDRCARAWRVWNEQKYEEAERLFLQATQADPRLADAWNGLGWSRQNMGQTQNAREAFERCVALDPKNAGALNGLGWIAKSERKQHEAIRHWELAIAAEPGATAALAGLASTELELGYYDLAAKHAQSWLNLEPGNAEAKRILEQARQKRNIMDDLTPRQKLSADLGRD